MKYTTWRATLMCGLAVSLGSVGLPTHGTVGAEEFAQLGGGGKGGGGGGGKVGGGNRGNGGGGGNIHVGGGMPRGGGVQGGGNFQHPNNGSRLQAPTRVPTQQPHNAGQPLNINRTPSLSRPTFHQTQKPVINPRIQGQNAVGTQLNLPGANIRGHGNVGVRNNLGVGSALNLNGGNAAGINHRPYVGNTVNLGGRSINVGSNAYQPAYSRHSGYHGFWNGNRGYGVGSGVVNNLGYGQGYNYGNLGGYGSGWGLGVGNNLGYGNGYGYNGLTSGYGGYGGGYGGYGYQPFGWGLGGWGLGSLMYNSGYLGYSNPYYNNTSSSVYNYSQPIPVSYNTAYQVAQDDPNSADELLNAADAAFQQNDFDKSLDLANQGIKQYPDDAVFHEFRALVLFARTDYQQAAAAIHSVLAIGPGWDWTTLSSMYADVGTYTTQLRALEAFTKANPGDAGSRFLLAYHYLSCGHTTDAARNLMQVVKLMPTDRIAADVLRMVSAPATNATPAATPRESTPTVAEVKPIDPMLLVGSWQAARPDNSTFQLKLTDDAMFTWSFAAKDQKAQEFGGTYSLDKNILALERKDGGSLIAQITPNGDGKFNFKLVGAPGDDLGLDFHK
jgi:tetratricopeptide (TPR) repeat protein